MIIWTAEFDDVQNYFELWMRRVLNGDPTVTLMPHENYLAMKDGEAAPITHG